MNDEIPFSNASVKVMRSHDYCHFEVCLGCDQPVSAKAVDDMRKEAARLADKAVAQYKISKRAAEEYFRESENYEYDTRRAKIIEDKPETERTVDEKAFLKAFEDREFHASRYDYDYEDGYDPPWEK